MHFYEKSHPTKTFKYVYFAQQHIKRAIQKRKKCKQTSTNLNANREISAFYFKRGVKMDQGKKVRKEGGRQMKNGGRVDERRHPL